MYITSHECSYVVQHIFVNHCLQYTNLHVRLITTVRSLIQFHLNIIILLMNEVGLNFKVWELELGIFAKLSHDIFLIMCYCLCIVYNISTKMF